MNVHSSSGGGGGGNDTERVKAYNSKAIPSVDSSVARRPPENATTIAIDILHRQAPDEPSAFVRSFVH